MTSLINLPVLYTAAKMFATPTAVVNPEDALEAAPFYAAALATPFPNSCAD